MPTAFSHDTYQDRPLINTEDIAFVACGAFSGLKSVTRKRGGGRMSFTRGDGYKAARLGYVGDASMLVVAPDPGRFDEIVASFDATFLAGLNAGLSTHALDLSMPRFEFESELSLQSLLAGLGMADAFDPIAADFSGISTQRDDLHIQDVLHKAFISVDEEGTEGHEAPRGHIV